MTVSLEAAAGLLFLLDMKNPSTILKDVSLTSSLFLILATGFGVVVVSKFNSLSYSIHFQSYMNRHSGFELETSTIKIIKL